MLRALPAGLALAAALAAGLALADAAGTELGLAATLAGAAGLAGADDVAGAAELPHADSSIRSAGRTHERYRLRDDIVPPRCGQGITNGRAGVSSGDGLHCDMKL